MLIVINKCLKFLSNHQSIITNNGNENEKNNLNENNIKNGKLKTIFSILKYLIFKNYNIFNSYLLEYKLDTQNSFNIILKSDDLQSTFKENHMKWKLILNKSNALLKKKTNNFVNLQLNNHLHKLKLQIDYNIVNYPKNIFFSNSNASGNNVYNNYELFQKESIKYEKQIELYLKKNDLFKKRHSKLWRSLFNSYLSERGIWKNNQNEKLYYKLDKTEDSLRRRMRHKRNFDFNQHLIASSNRDHQTLENKKKEFLERKRTEMELINKVPSFLTKINIINEQVLNLENENEDEDENENENDNDNNDDDDNNNNNNNGSDKLNEDDESNMNVDDGLNSNLTKNKNRLFEIDCQLITLHDNVDGILTISNQNIQFNSIENNFKNKIWKLKKIEKIYKRRFMLNHSALEFFTTIKTSFYLNFANLKSRNRCYNKIINSNLPNFIKISDTDKPSKFFKKWEYTKLWQYRSISTFEYLMHLNTLANRSYNDLSQYPIFPWVLSDYVSKEIDLNDSKYFRDLSKPMGAINEEKLQTCIERYELLKSTDSPIPPFLYGSHYSNFGVVLYFLIRIEPFTSMAINLQAGKFDRPDRLFHSIQTTFNACTNTSSEFFELPPEFYYLPEFLYNLNNFDLGVTQNEKRIGNVELPPWANNSAEEFIRINREALESDYVSKNINNWIDLIFGYKQRGKEAEKANNIFYYLTYEGAVNFDKIEDEVLLRSIISQIKDFGQCPSQLLTNKPHPKRITWNQLNPLQLSLSTGNFNIQPRLIQDDGDLAISYLLIGKQLFGLDNSSIKIIACNENKYIKIYQYFLNTSSSNVGGGNNDNDDDDDITTNENNEIQSNDNKLENNNTNLNDNNIDNVSNNNRSINLINKKIINIDFPQSDLIQYYNNKFVISQNGKFIFYLSKMDSSFTIYNLQDKSLMYNIIAHKDLITCIDSKMDFIVTGSKDTTLILWRLDKNERQYCKLLSILYGHDDEVTCVKINISLGIIVSGSKDGTIIIHSLWTGKYLRTIKTGISQLIKISIDGEIICFTNQIIKIFSINGLALCELRFPYSINCWDLVSFNNKKYLIIGTRNGLVFLKSLYNLKNIKSWSIQKQEIISLVVDQKNCKIVIGTNTGKIYLI
ncbi:beige/beach-related [Anaeramoeba flamelloides]|uniref:Beige/beach-related n=1 Tax=Anaeramoeba flamelloides TaxID=1746091 RepID=A0AAV7ZM82_9EUKA|nr:beige/beach-related [Anaeramoeba flamelloides]